MKLLLPLSSAVGDVAEGALGAVTLFVAAVLGVFGDASEGAVFEPLAA